MGHGMYRAQGLGVGSGCPGLSKDLIIDCGVESLRNSLMKCKGPGEMPEEV